MSGLLAGKVWQSNLDSHLKPLAAAMADIANDDGSRIFPSVAYLAWLLGKGDRSVQQGLAELKSLGVIEAVAFQSGGRNHPTEYRLIEAALPYRVPWKELRKGAEVAPFTEPKGATNDIKGCNFEQQRVQIPAERVKCTAPDPLVEPSLDPLVEPPYSGTAFLTALAAYDSTAKQRKVKESPDQRRVLFKKLERWGEVLATEALEDTVANSWRGVFEPKNGAGNGTNKKRFESSPERNARNLRENAEYIRGLQNGGSPTDCEDPIGLLTSGI